MSLYRRDGTPYPDGEAGMMEWARDWENIRMKRVRQTVLQNGMWVSTVWLGLDHSFMENAPPKIFETMVFRGKNDFHSFECHRYSTEDQAIKGHYQMCRAWERKVGLESLENKEMN